MTFIPLRDTRHAQDAWRNACHTEAIAAGGNRKTAHRPLRRAAFLDRDGFLLDQGAPGHADLNDPALAPHAIEGLRLLQDGGFRLIVVTNQAGLARRTLDRGALNRAHMALSARLREEGIHIDDYFVCPHAPAPTRMDPGCLCRKPAPGLLRQAALTHSIELGRSWMVGNILNDVEAGHRAGCRSALVDAGHETEWRLSPIRQPDIRVGNLLEAARGILASDVRDTPVTPARPHDALT